MQFFSFFLFGHNKTRNKDYDAVDRKETFFDYKNNTFSTTQKWHFPKELTYAFGQKMHFF